MLRNRCSLVMAPPEMQSAPSRWAPPNADQNPMNGPNEKAKKMRSAAVTPAAGYTCSDHMRSHHSHDSAVSSQRRGLSPLEPDVWCRRTKRSIGKVRLVPKGGCAAWSASTSDFAVIGRRSKSSHPLTSCSRARQKALVASTPASPARSLSSCWSRSSSKLISDCAVADLKCPIKDLEALVELGLGDAQRRV